MKSSIIALGAFLVAAVSAQPHGRYAHKQAHANKHAKREMVIVTDYVEVTETLVFAATVWVDKKGNTISAPVTGEAISTALGEPVTSIHSAGVFHEPEPTSTKLPEPTPTPSPAPVVESPKTTTVPTSTTTVQVSSVAPVSVQPTLASAYVAPVVSTAAYVAPAVSTPEYVAPAVSTPEYVAPVVATSTPEPVPTPTPTPTPTPEYVAPVASTPAASSAPAQESTSSSTSISGPCGPDSPCTGDITFYAAGLGACGDTTDGLSESVVALAHGMMGTQSNGNPYCGRMVSITLNGVTATAKVVDKCMGCADGDLDLSEMAFASLGIDQSVGRTKAKWHFTS